MRLQFAELRNVIPIQQWLLTVEGRQGERGMQSPVEPEPSCPVTGQTVKVPNRPQHILSAVCM